MSTRAELHGMIDDVLGDDPRRALIAYRRLSTEHLEWLEQRVVALARRNEWSWARIGRLLGRSRQAVHRRFRSLSSQLPRRVPRLNSEMLREARWLQKLQAAEQRRHEFETLDPGDAVPW